MRVRKRLCPVGGVAGFVRISVLGGGEFGVRKRRPLTLQRRASQLARAMTPVPWRGSSLQPQHHSSAAPAPTCHSRNTSSPRPPAVAAAPSRPVRRHEPADLAAAPWRALDQLRRHRAQQPPPGRQDAALLQAPLQIPADGLRDCRLGDDEPHNSTEKGVSLYILPCKAICASCDAYARDSWLTFVAEA